MSVAIVVAKLGSLLKAVASSFKVSNVAGAEFTRLATAVDRLASVEQFDKPMASILDVMLRGEVVVSTI